jgi:hypothetical protein
MMMVSQKNADGGQQRQSVSLVMVSAKGRVAVYDVALKLAAAFTLRLSSAPVASIKAPLSIPSAASGTSANSRPNAPAAAAPSTAISYNDGSSQKVLFLLLLLLLEFDFFKTFELQCAFHGPIFFRPLLYSLPSAFSTCEKNVMISLQPNYSTVHSEWTEGG